MEEKKKIPYQKTRAGIKNRKYVSLLQRLRKEGRVNEEFEIQVSKLTIEELIVMKLELAVRGMTTHKFYGFPLWYALPEMIKQIIINFAANSTTSEKDMALLLGLTKKKTRLLKDKYFKIKLY